MPTDSKPIDFSDLTNPDAIPTWIEQFEQLGDVIQKRIVDVQTLAGAMGQKIKATPLPDNSEALKKENQAKVTAIGLDGQLTQAYKAQIEVRQKVNQLSSQYKDYLQKEKGGIDAMKIAFKDSKKETDALAASYFKLKDSSKASAEAIKDAKAQWDESAKSTNQLAERLKAIDASSGLHTRNVGNYAEAWKGYAKAVGGAAGLTEIMGMAIGLNEEVLRSLGVIHSTIRVGLRDLNHVTEAQTEATTENTSATELNVAAGEAQVAENEEVAASWYMALGPIGWVAAALVALTAVILIATEVTKKHREELIERSKTADGLIIVDKEAREEYIRQAQAINELTNKYKVLTGAMSETDASIDQLRFNYKMDSQEFKNQTDEKLHKAKSFWQGMSYLYDDIYAGNMKDKNGELMNDEQELIALDSQRTEQMKKIVLEQEILNQLTQKSIEMTKVLNEAKQKGEEFKVEDNFNIGDAAKEAARLKIKAKYDEEDIKLTEKDEDIKAMKIAQIHNALAGDLKLIQDKLTREHKIQTLTDILDSAKASKDRLDIAQAEYTKGLYELKENQIKRQATKQQIAQENATFEKQHQEELLQIRRQNEDVFADIEHKKTELILNTYDRERKKAEDTYNDDLRNYTRLYEDKKITLADYQKYILAAGDKEKQAQDEIDRQQKAKSTGITDENAVNAAKNKTKKDTVGLSNTLTRPKELLQDQLKENQAEMKKALDDANAADSEAMLKGEMTEQQHLDKIANLKEDYRLRDLEATKTYNDKIIDLESQQLSEVADALNQALQEQGKAQQDALQANATSLAAEEQAQATLAASGYKNTLDQTLRDQAANAEQQKELARKQAQEQEAIELSKMLMTAMNAYMKGGDNPGAAFLKALTQVELAKALAAGISGAYYDGTADTGVGGRLDNRGGFLGILHPKEAVISRNRNQEAPGVADAWLKGDYSRMAMLLPRVKNDVNKDEQITKMMIDAATTKLATAFEKAIMEQPQITSTTDGKGQVVTQILQGGSRKTIIMSNSPIIPYDNHLK